MSKDWTGGFASIFKTIGASNHADAERQAEDYYATEPKATEWLCRLEHFDGPILEPSCGEGHMSKVLEAHGYDVTSRDIVDRGYGDVADFLADTNTSWNGDIVTNPPYKYALDFVLKALRIVPEGKKVAMFLKLTFLEGKTRRLLFNSTPPSVFGLVRRGSNVRLMATSTRCKAVLLVMRGLSGRRGTQEILL